MHFRAITISMESGEVAHPVITLIDEHGDKAHIIVDNNCYVLCVVKRVPDEGKTYYQETTHWFQEAVTALRSLPIDPTVPPTGRPLMVPEELKDTFSRTPEEVTREATGNFEEGTEAEETP